MFGRHLGHPVAAPIRWILTGDVHVVAFVCLFVSLFACLIYFVYLGCCFVCLIMLRPIVTSRHRLTKEYHVEKKRISRVPEQTTGHWRDMQLRHLNCRTIFTPSK